MLRIRDRPASEGTAGASREKLIGLALPDKLRRSILLSR